MIYDFLIAPFAEFEFMRRALAGTLSRYSALSVPAALVRAA